MKDNEVIIWLLVAFVFFWFVLAAMPERSSQFDYTDAQLDSQMMIH